MDNLCLRLVSARVITRSPLTCRRGRLPRIQPAPVTVVVAVLWRNGSSRQSRNVATIRHSGKLRDFLSTVSQLQKTSTPKTKSASVPFYIYNPSVHHKSKVWKFMKSDLKKKKKKIVPPLVSSGVPSDVALITVFFWGTLLHQYKINEWFIFFVLLLLLAVKSLLCGSTSWSSCQLLRPAIGNDGGLPCLMPDL